MTCSSQRAARSVQLAACGSHLVQLEGGNVERQPPLLDPRDVEDVVDQVEQQRARVARLERGEGGNESGGGGEGGGEV